jgi:translation initiation factor 2 beta subunit (eIF-2beta)/eIF-5
VGQREYTNYREKEKEIMREIHEIAREIRADWKKVHYSAVPYLQAMLRLGTLSDSYGYDSAKEIVLRFLCNAGTWKGETAKKVKAELKSMLKPVKGKGN